VHRVDPGQRFVALTRYPILQWHWAQCNAAGSFPASMSMSPIIDFSFDFPDLRMLRVE